MDAAVQKAGAVGEKTKEQVAMSRLESVVEMTSLLVLGGGEVINQCEEHNEQNTKLIEPPLRRLRFGEPVGEELDLNPRQLKRIRARREEKMVQRNRALSLVLDVPLSE